jgi:hypothetical protein
LNQEIKKKLEGNPINFKQIEKQWSESFLKENAGKSVKRVSKIIKKM